MGNIERSLKFVLEWDDKEKNEYNPIEIQFRRHKTSAFEYGNGSAVTVYHSGKSWFTEDTRYDLLVMSQFRRWCFDQIEKLFAPGYTIKEVGTKEKIPLRSGYIYTTDIGNTIMDELKNLSVDYDISDAKDLANFTKQVIYELECCIMDYADDHEIDLSGWKYVWADYNNEFDLI